MKRHIDVADYFSFFNVIFGFLAIIMRDPRFIFIAAIMDGFDGYLARKGYSGRYGKFTDSLADFASFGVATAYFFPALALPYLLAGMYRLARFSAEEHRNFIGFPITSSALIAISVEVIFNSYTAGILSIGLAFLMVSNVQYPKIRNPYLLLPAAVILAGTVFRKEFIYGVLVLNILYLISPLFRKKLGKYF